MHDLNDISDQIAAEELTFLNWFCTSKRGKSSGDEELLDHDVLMRLKECAVCTAWCTDRHDESVER